MTIALGLLVTTLFVGGVGPTYLRTSVTPSVRPRLALAGWVGSLALVVAAPLLAAALLVLPHATTFDGLIGMAHSCVNVIRPGGSIAWEHVARLAGAALVLGLAARVTVVALGMVRRQRRWRAQHLALLGLVCRAERAVLWLEEDAPVAYSIGGRAGRVVATRGIARLRPRERAAVLAHERAHLRGRHHLLVLAAEIVAAALPFVPLFRQAPAAVRVLAELAADATAARQHGPGPVRSALLAVARHGAPSASLAMSRDAVDARLHWLDAGRPAPRRLPARVDCSVAVLLSLTPALLSVATVAVAVLLYCLRVTGG